MKTLTRIGAVSFTVMFDNEDRKALSNLFGLTIVALGTAAVALVSGAGILGLAVRIFQLTSG